MYIEQLYTGCLAEAAYYVESNGQAAIIDPLRDVEPYLEMAEKRGAEIKYVLETHFHADFVSGHLDLAKKTGARIVYGPTAQPSFEAYVAEDNEILPLGKLKLKVLHTPGHTLESVTYLLINEEGEDEAIFTGDTLFIGDVGRPDLAVKSDLSQEDLARHLYRSLRKKIMPLGDEVTVYPGHGQGSACGKNMSSETVDKLGNQKSQNYALDPQLSEDDFIREVTEGLVTPPQYFPKNAVLNKQGYAYLEDIMDSSLKALSPEEFQRYAQDSQFLVLDTRYEEDFLQEHIPNALYIGLHDNFAPWVGALIEDLQQPIIFIAEPGREQEVVTRLSRVGYDNAYGYLEGGMEAWKKAQLPVTHTAKLSLQDLEENFPQYQDQLLDVRKVSEYNRQHLQNVANYPLDRLPQQLGELQPNTTYYAHCAGGYRSVIAASLLERRGYQAASVEGGFDVMLHRQLPLTALQEVENML